MTTQRKSGMRSGVKSIDKTREKSGATNGKLTSILGRRREKTGAKFMQKTTRSKSIGLRSGTKDILRMEVCTRKDTSIGHRAQIELLNTDIKN
jgi:hypothetical protein